MPASPMLWRGVIYQRLPYVSMGNKRAAAATWYLTVGRALREKEG